jgi:hypothetical protein
MGLKYADAVRAGIAELHPDHPGSVAPAGPHGPGSWEFVIPGWHPTRLNELLGHHMKAARLKSRDREIVRDHCLLAGVPPASGKRRVTLRVVLAKGQRAGDPDCYWKSVLDALVSAGVLSDDNRQGVELAPVEFDRSRAKSTVIRLENLI